MDMQRNNKEAIDLEPLVRLSFSLGASKARVISSNDILVEKNLAELCVNNCENYGLSINCPPHVSGPEGFCQIKKNCRHAVVLRIDLPSAILFSSERGEIMQLLHEIVSEVEQAAIQTGYVQSKAFAGGSCKKIFCHDHAECRVLSKNGECRYPRARPSMSGFGINVSELMKTCGWSPDVHARASESKTDSMSWVAGLILIG